MPTSLRLPAWLANEGWKIKIRDRERLEPPHATVIRGRDYWRWDLRAQRFMDVKPPPNLVPAAIVDLLRAAHEQLVIAWDETYPGNPVETKEDA